MQTRILRLLTLIAIAATVSCGDASRDKSGQTDFKGQTTSPPDTTKQPDATPDSSTPTGGEKQTPAPANEPAPVVNEEDKASQLITNGVREQEVPAYVVPPEIRERLKASHPELLPPKSTKFKITGQHLKIDATNSRITFTGTLNIAGKQPEALELACSIDKSQVPWECSDMYPTNLRVAAEKRLQGTFECLDTYRCDKVGVKIFVVVNGKLQPPQTFQAEGFTIRKATSGDIAEDDSVDTEQAPPPPPKKQIIDQVPEERSNDPKKLEKPTPAVTEKPKKQYYDRIEPDTAAGTPPKPVIPDPTQPARQSPVTLPVAQQDSSEDDSGEELKGEELKAALKDPNVAVEITTPMNLPAPKKGKFSIPGIEKSNPPIGAGVPNQAIGAHNSGYLRQANELPASGPGFVSRDHGSMDFATDLMVYMIKNATAVVAKAYPGQTPIMVASISKRIGGKLCGRSGHCHKSHRTGLDADIAFPAASGSRLTGMWDACASSGGGCSDGAHIQNDFDEKRFWLLIKQMTCADNKPVIAMFLDTQIKKHMCRYVQTTSEARDRDVPGKCAFRALQALYYAAGHNNHVHVRLRCPGNRDCQNAIVTLGSGNGC